MAIAKTESTVLIGSQVARKGGKDVSELLNSSFRNDKRHDVVIRRILSGIDSPRSLAIWLLFANNEHDQLVELDVDPLHYTDHHRFRDDYCATELLSKSDFLKLSSDRRAAALEKFDLAEDRCRETNHLLRCAAHEAVGGRIKDYSLASCLSDMAFKISSVLGDFDPEEFIDACAWGPGSTYFLPRKYASQYNKFLREKGSTEVCREFLSPWFALAYPLWARAGNLAWLRTDGLLDCEIAPGNKIITVPKNAKADRVICVEPGLNLWFQKGIGMMIRRRLRRCGNSIDLQDRNQQLALAAVRRNLATVDFSAASDTIAYELVQSVMPSNWLRVMDRVRSASGQLEGRTFRWEKYSTMGNGFTFELETLLFWSLAIHCCNVVGCATDDVSVFGDDVVIPADALPLFETMSSKIGFQVNRKKTHSQGLFRESCGEHYFDGYDTKPLYLKKRPTVLPDLFKLANGIRSLAHRFTDGHGCSLRFRGVWSYTVDWVPEELRLKGPRHLGDSVIHENWDACTPPRLKNGWDGWNVRAIGNQPRRYRGRSALAWLAERVKAARGSDILFRRNRRGALVCSADLSSLETRGLITSSGGGAVKLHPSVPVFQWHDWGGWV